MDRLKYCISIMTEDKPSENYQSDGTLYPYYSNGYDEGCGHIFINDLRALYDYFEASGGKLFEVSVYSDIDLTKMSSDGCRELVSKNDNGICWAAGDSE